MAPERLAIALVEGRLDRPEQGDLGQDEPDAGQRGRPLGLHVGGRLLPGPLCHLWLRSRCDQDAPPIGEPWAPNEESASPTRQRTRRPPSWAGPLAGSNSGLAGSRLKADPDTLWARTPAMYGQWQLPISGASTSLCFRPLSSAPPCWPPAPRRSAPLRHSLAP